MTSAPDKLSSRNQPEPFQTRVAPWMDVTFGAMISGDKEERAHRFLEEALELVQSTGTTASEAHQLVDYVFDRPAGETHQEVGGVMVTLAALCLAHALDMHEAGETELARVWTKVEQIRAKQAAKPKHSPLPEHVGTPGARWRVEGQTDPHGDRYDCERAKLGLGSMTDDELANAVFMRGGDRLDLAAIQRGEPSPISLLTAAKDRIRWLSRQLEAAKAANEEAR